MPLTKKLVKSRPGFRAAFCISTAALLFLTGCAAPQPLDLASFHSPGDTPRRLSICHGYGCLYKSKVYLSRDEWQKIEDLFADIPQDAEQERAAIASYIAAIESAIGEKAGTDVDKAGATMFGYGTHQLDCIDETINTTNYLSFLVGKKLLRFHEPAVPLRRGAFIDGRWPHNTAAIRELETGRTYAVDSWYKKDGETPYIIPAETWLEGWRP